MPRIEYEVNRIFHELLKKNRCNYNGNDDDRNKHRIHTQQHPPYGKKEKEEEVTNKQKIKT